MKNLIPTLKKYNTPYYWYDMTLLEDTLASIKKESSKYGFHVHYAMKANANVPILEKIKAFDIGIDCVSGNEILRSIQVGFESKKVVFAGVGKTDEEIKIGLQNDIFCFNVESIQELEVINEIAGTLNKSTKVALRLNPNVAASTHKYITTGLNENKFGINIQNLDKVLAVMDKLSNIELTGIHFHIGSQITDITDFEKLCVKINELQEWFEEKGIVLQHINAGGGLGIDYMNPNENQIPDFKRYFQVFAKNLKLRAGQELHFELGRSIVGQCGSLITKVLFTKDGTNKKFVIVDAGITELIRPAFYSAFHLVENLTSDLPLEKCDIVGPICESADFFSKDAMIAGANRDDLLVVRSAGAYGEVMANQYNLRNKVKAYYSDKFTP